MVKLHLKNIQRTSIPDGSCLELLNAKMFGLSLCVISKSGRKFKLMVWYQTDHEVYEFEYDFIADAWIVVIVNICINNQKKRIMPEWNYRLIDYRFMAKLKEPVNSKSKFQRVDQCR